MGQIIAFATSGLVVLAIAILYYLRRKKRELESGTEKSKKDEALHLRNGQRILTNQYDDPTAIFIGDIVWFAMWGVIFGLPTIASLILCISFGAPLWVIGIMAIVVMATFFYVGYKILFSDVPAGEVGTETFTSGGGRYDTRIGGGFWGTRHIPGFTEPQTDSIEYETITFELPAKSASVEMALPYLKAEDVEKFTANELHQDSPVTIFVTVKGKLDGREHYTFIRNVGKYIDIVHRIKNLLTTIIPGKVSQFTSTEMIQQERYAQSLIAEPSLTELKAEIEGSSAETNDRSTKWAYFIDKINLIGKAPKELLDGLTDVGKARLKIQENEHLAAAAKKQAEGQKEAMLEVAAGAKGAAILESEGKLEAVKNEMLGYQKKAETMKDPEVKKIVYIEYEIEALEKNNATIFMNHDGKTDSVASALLKNFVTTKDKPEGGPNNGND